MGRKGIDHVYETVYVVDPIVEVEVVVGFWLIAWLWSMSRESIGTVMCSGYVY